MLSIFDLNLRHLGACVAIQRHGGIGAASAAVSLSQPAVTQALAKMERLLGHRLFDREPTGATATQAGSLFLARAERAIQHLNDGGQRARRASRPGPQIERSVTMAQLHALDTVERHRNYTRAAREMAITQPSIHKAVKELELQLGSPLLVRGDGQMRATPSGAFLVRAIRLAAAELQSALDELAALTEGGAGRISIGALPLPKASLLPEALARFSQAHPRATITIVEGAFEELLVALRQGGIDVLVGGLRDPLPAPDVVQRPLFTYRLSIVGRRDHPLAGNAAPKAEELAAYPWITSAPGAPMRAQWEALFEGADLPQQCIATSSVLTTRGLLLNGDWLALMSPDQFYIEATASLLTQIGAPLPGSERPIGMTTRADWYPTEAQSSFVADLVHSARRTESGMALGDRP